MNSEVGGCRPATYVLGVGIASCDKCPFPFCVVAEASIIKYELKEHLARIMRRLGNSMEETAKAMKVSIRSTYRYTSAHEHVSCAQCNLLHSQDVMCRSNTYTVVCKDGQYVTILNKHGHATERELWVVECFIEYVFPNSIAERSTNGHDYWALSRIELEEAKKFEGMCAALNMYTLSLNGGRECLQVTRQ